MKKLLFLMLTTFALNAFAMRQEQVIKKDFSKEDVIELDFHGVKHPKKVIIITPSTMSKGKAETYFRKNGKKVSAKILELIDITLQVLYANDKVGYPKEGVPAGLNKELFLLLAHPGSILMHKAETECLLIERKLESVKGSWYFTMLAQINACKALPAGGSCEPLMVQMHHDKGNVHDKIWISELRSFFAQSTLPVIKTELGECFVLKTACPDTQSFMQVKDYDEMLATVAQFFIVSRKEYKNLK